MADKPEESKKQTSQELILDLIAEKSAVKQKVYDNSREAFTHLKQILKTGVDDMNKVLKKIDPRIALSYKDRGMFEAEIKVAGDLLIFNMHSNIFQFDNNHWVRKTSYVKEDEMRTYSSVISIYNFLSDSFKYNRKDDVGYLIARIFINKEKHYFVEGKRQLGFLYRDFGTAIMDKDTMRKIIESSILYAIDFDLLVPSYDDVKFATVEQMLQRINKSKVRTGKRLGFRFQADKDDVVGG